jgi:hypothetical protein
VFAVYALALAPSLLLFGESLGPSSPLQTLADLHVKTALVLFAR